MSRPLRRTQAISPFGVGAMVDFPGPVSLIHAGLDAWPFSETDPAHHEFRVDDEKRLARRLGVDYFVQPPDFRYAELGQEASQRNLQLRLPFLRFPLWHVCPRCGRMHVARHHDRSPPSCRGPIGSSTDRGKEHSTRKTVQVRFVAACKHGHLRDFPWLEWLFKVPRPEWDPNGQHTWLRMRSTGSASLGGVEIAAEERKSGEISIAAKRTLAGAFERDATTDSPSAFIRLGIVCEGHNPVLNIGGARSDQALPGCGQHLYPLLRGASNLYFPQVVSSIYIPEIDDRHLSQEILDLLDDQRVKTSLLDSALQSENGLVTSRAAKIALNRHYPESPADPEKLADAANKHVLKDLLVEKPRIRAFLSQKMKISPDHQLTAEMVKTAIQTNFPDWAIDPAVLLPSLKTWFTGKDCESDERAEPQQDSLAEEGYRLEEYRVLSRDVQEGYPKTNLLIRSSSIDVYGAEVTGFFERVSLLHKLRETRAFVGFSRIFPENELPPLQRWALIASERKRWLPGIVVRGEGIFIKFREDRLSEWIGAHGASHVRRLARINRNMDELRTRRHQVVKTIAPKFVLLHSFAHLLINQLVYDCGYGSASLRERIYAADGDNPMSGLLIYTAAGDSEGTMGGLVRMGQPGRLEDAIARALDKARWCSTDPVCIESPGQGPDNCNLAACHSCALLPETSCEEQNRLLDRGVVIGTLDEPDVGFFSKDQG